MGRQGGGAMTISKYFWDSAIGDKWCKIARAAEIAALAPTVLQDFNVCE